MVFISLEGVDGSGKTTVSKILKDDFLSKGFNILLTREPGGEEISESIRKLILDQDNVDMNAWTEALLYIAARKQHLDKVVVPALKDKTIVICDRFMDSTTVYQGFARHLGIADIDEIQNIVLGSMKPDLTIFFDISPQEARVRMMNRSRKADRLDNEDITFHEKVYEGYQVLISQNNDRIKVVDARKPINEVAQQAAFLIQNILDERLK